MKRSIASPMGQLTTKCQELGGGLATPREGVNRPRAARKQTPSFRPQKLSALSQAAAA